MSSLISAVQDLIASILNVFRSILATIFSLFENVTAVFTSLVSSVVDLASGLIGFILGNIVIIGIIVAAFVGYSAYRQKRQGGGVTAGKKRA